MNHSLSLPEVSIPSYSLTPSGNINITNMVSTNLPLEIWGEIFSHLAFKELKLFTEHKVRVLKEPLNGYEDNHLLMLGRAFILEKKDFLDVVKSVYNLALCCKGFYVLTQRERRLLINNAFKWRPKDIVKENKNTRFIKDLEDLFTIPKNPFLERFNDEERKENIKRLMDRLPKDTSKVFVETLKREPIIKLDLNKSESFVKNLVKKIDFFEEIKIENKNQTSTEKEGEPSNSNDKRKCVIQ